ncbi:MAG TPA: AAA family ATPase [Bacteroidetes bacterium]|nr:AAA family ATPase [Bacteroidota bacterium]
MNIRQLINQPEGKTLEFKRDLSSSVPVVKTLVAFANSAGGRLLIGVEDNRKVVGVEHPLDEEERLCSIIADSITPRLVPNIELITIEDNTLLIVEVFPSGLRPHFIKAQGRDKGVYVRLGSSNRQADRELTGELLRSIQGVSFDESPLTKLSVNDIDITAIQHAFADDRTISAKKLLTLKLLTTEQGNLVPTIGAVLLFGKERIFHFPDAWIQCGRFIGKDKADIFDHIELYDHLPQAIESIMLFLKKHAMRGADFSDIRRKDVWSIPLTILREMIINALVHSDYSQRGAPIRIAFFDDRIEVENPGILLPGMTIDDMKQGISKIRNPVIARVFRELNLIEQWGSGVRRIFKEAENLKLPPLEIVEIGMRLRFTVYLATPVKPAIEALKHIGVESGVGSGVESPASNMKFQILTLLKQSSLAKSQIATELGKTKPNRYLNDLMHKLRTDGCVEYTIPDKPNSRLQRYRLTSTGARLIS